MRVARCLNLIAGDGQTNVLHLNTLDWKKWGETTKEQNWLDTYNDGWKRLRRLRAKRDGDRAFNFDVLMANPPFAGDIKQGEMLSAYELAHKKNGKLERAVGRDLLFIERNLDFLKPGGRMAVVLPQGRFNNASDQRVREFIAERCRILAEVGLHPNTFKPHTGTKTSVLFVQKWNDDFDAGPLCPKVDDYEIFFATQRLPSKDTSGDKILVKGADGAPLRDTHGHYVVQHDFFNHDGQTQDGIAEAFAEFAARERLSFLSRPFDAKRYKCLLEGLDAAEARWSMLERTKRIDSEFFSKRHLRVSKLVRHVRSQDIASLAAVSDGNHFSIADQFVEKDGVPYYRGQDGVGHAFIEQSSPRLISRNAFQQPYMTRSHLRKGDVLLSIVGTIGESAIVTSDKPAACSCKLAILRPRSILPGYLSAYLRSEMGRSQSARYTRGAVQMGLPLEDMDQIRVARFSPNTEKRIAQAVEQARVQITSASEDLTQAEASLIAALGLADWQPPKPLSYSQRASKAFTSGRLDAEYFAPRVSELLTRLRAGGRTIGDVAPARRLRFVPFGGGEFRYIEIGNVASDGTVNVELVAMAAAPSRATQLVRAGDVLTSTVRPIRRLSALVLPEQDGAVASSGFVVLQPRAVAAEALMTYLRLPLVCELMDLHTSASLYPAISESDLLNLPFPEVAQSDSETITKCVQEAHASRRRARELLAAAQRAVEIAIEKDEAAAVAHLDGFDVAS